MLWKPLLLSRIALPKRNHISILLSMELLQSCNKNRLTLKSYSKHYKVQPFHFVYKNYCIPTRFLELSQCRKFAFYQIICTFNIIHNSLILKCYECIFDNIEPWDFMGKRKFLITHQKDETHTFKTFSINYVKGRLYVNLRQYFMNW